MSCLALSYGSVIHVLTIGQHKKGRMMENYTISWKETVYQEALVRANSLEEAQDIAGDIPLATNDPRVVSAWVNGEIVSDSREILHDTIKVHVATEEELLSV